MKHTSFRLPRCPILNTFPATLFRPSPKLKLYLFHPLRTISELSMYGGTSTAVTVSLYHSSFWVQFFKPHASTASLQYEIEIWKYFESAVCSNSNPCYMNCFIFPKYRVRQICHGYECRICTVAIQHSYPI